MVDVGHVAGGGVAVAVRPGPGLSESLGVLQQQVTTLTAQLERLRAELRTYGIAEPGTAAGLRVELLGSLRASLDGVEVSRWGGRRSRMAFAFVASRHPRAVHREELIEALWPGCDPAGGRNNLNQAIHGVRAAFRKAGV